ncbi:hypothetical protein F5Y17DRAFT_463652 [Xylariaceae sp. FL0594]|nr:hypothetical protein F5Y17DRAFT_463652 [Xylariaceae sp. FL0594]
MSASLGKEIIFLASEAIEPGLGGMLKMPWADQVQHLAVRVPAGEPVTIFATDWRRLLSCLRRAPTRLDQKKEILNRAYAEVGRGCTDSRDHDSSAELEKTPALQEGYDVKDPAFQESFQTPALNRIHRLPRYTSLSKRMPSPKAVACVIGYAVDAVFAHEMSRPRLLHEGETRSGRMESPSLSQAAQYRRWSFPPKTRDDSAATRSPKIGPNILALVSALAQDILDYNEDKKASETAMQFGLSSGISPWAGENQGENPDSFEGVPIPVARLVGKRCGAAEWLDEVIKNINMPIENMGVLFQCLGMPIGRLPMRPPATDITNTGCLPVDRQLEGTGPRVGPKAHLYFVVVGDSKTSCQDDGKSIGYPVGRAWPLAPRRARIRGRSHAHAHGSRLGHDWAAPAAIPAAPSQRIKASTHGGARQDHQGLWAASFSLLATLSPFTVPVRASRLLREILGLVAHRRLAEEERDVDAFSSSLIRVTGSKQASTRSAAKSRMPPTSAVPFKAFGSRLRKASTRPLPSREGQATLQTNSISRLQPLPGSPPGLSNAPEQPGLAAGRISGSRRLSPFWALITHHRKLRASGCLLQSPLPERAGNIKLGKTHR